jgi:hypothetical protein
MMGARALKGEAMGLILSRAAFALACFAASGAHAQTGGSSVYKWVDAKGMVHYADKPALASESSRQERAIGKGELGAGDDLAAQRQLAQASRDGAQAKREAEQSSSASAKAQQALVDRSKACEAAMEAARALASGGRVATVNAQGERVFLEEAQIVERAIAAQKAQDQACSPPKAPPA